MCTHLLYTGLYSCPVSSLGADLSTVLFSHVVESRKSTNTIHTTSVQLSHEYPGAELFTYAVQLPTRRHCQNHCQKLALANHHSKKWDIHPNIHKTELQITDTCEFLRISNSRYFWWRSLLIHRFVCPSACLPVQVSFIIVVRHHQSLYDVARLHLTAPMDFW